MIIDLLLDFLEATVAFAVSPLPTSDTDPFAHLQTIVSNLGALNYFLPIAETVGIVVAVFALFPAFLGVTLVLWITAQLRGSSSAG